MLPLVRELVALQRDAALHLTATTRTGRARLAESGHPATLAPVDAPQAVARFFDGVAPRRVFIVETELWPHWLLAARAREIPVALASARLSENSVEKYELFGAPFRELVAGLAAVLCQSPEDAGRWVAIGARPDRVAVVGNLKNDALPEPAESRERERLALGFDPARPLFVAGSLRPGEARVLAQAWRRLPEAVRAAWQVVVVPRHGRATAELRSELREAGVASSASPQADPGAFGFDDRAGVLVGYYRAADAALVGGSLQPYGGHNPLEPAACGCAVVVGVHTEHQREAVRALEQGEGVAIVDGAGALAAALGALLEDAEARERAAAAALAVTRALRGGAKRAAVRLAAAGLWPVA